MSDEQKTPQTEDNFFSTIYYAFKRKITGYRPDFEQHIALFGESGSGKTTLLTFFYGYQAESAFQKEAGYRLLAEDTTQGQTLLNSYYKITEKNLPGTRLASREYRFTIRLNDVTDNIGRLVWHDYPGEWWTETKTGEEQADKEKTFLSLMASDVALFLVDGEKLKKEGDRYLKCLFCHFRDELCRIKATSSLKEKMPLEHCPRVWTICLTKSDLLPEITAEGFREYVLRVAYDEMKAVQQEIKAIIKEPDFFNFGDDYLILSVGEYDENNEKITNKNKHKGFDLIAPIAFTVPVKRARWWQEKKTSAVSVAGNTLEITRKLTTGWMKWIPFVGYYLGLLDQMTKKNVGNLLQKKEEAIKKGYFIDAVLIAFEQKLHSYGIEKTYIAPND